MRCGPFKVQSALPPATFFYLLLLQATSREEPQRRRKEELVSSLSLVFVTFVEGETSDMEKSDVLIAVFG